MKVYKDRRLYATWPISTGRAGRETPNGTYLSIEKANPQHMVGEGYDIEVPYSVRFTWSGDFVHAAPWSVGVQGYANVSHGCVNLSPERAQTYYGMSIPGDPVTVTGSPKGGKWDDGWTVWFLSWKAAREGKRASQGGAGGAGRQHPGPALRPQAVEGEGAARSAEVGQRGALVRLRRRAAGGVVITNGNRGAGEVIVSGPRRWRGRRRSAGACRRLRRPPSGAPDSRRPSFRGGRCRVIVLFLIVVESVPVPWRDRVDADCDVLLPRFG